MIIILGHNFYQQPGGEDIVFNLEKELLKNNHHEIYEYTENNQRIEELNRFSLLNQTIWSNSSREKLRNQLQIIKPDIVHFHNTFPLISPAVYTACREMGVPVVQTLHNFRLLCPSALFLRNEKVCEACLGKTPPWPGVLYACYRQSRTQTAVVAAMLTSHRILKTWQKQVDVYIALTDFARQKFIEGGLPPEKIVVKPNFITPDPLPGNFTGDYAFFVGRLSAEKGVKTLLEAWKSLKDIPLKIAGGGPLREKLHQYIQEYNLENVELLGYTPREEVLQILKNARCMIFPSQWYEGFPMVIAEAFACGVPVIASRLGAMQEIVADGFTGRHFTPSSVTDLVDKIKWAWENTRLMMEMGKNARHEYEQKYTAEKNYQTLTRIYEEILNNR